MLVTVAVFAIPGAISRLRKEVRGVVGVAAFQAPLSPSIVTLSGLFNHFVVSRVQQCALT